MKKSNGIARIYIVVFAVVLIIIGAIVVAFILNKPQVNFDKNEEMPVSKKEENQEIDNNNNNNKSINMIEKEVQNGEELIFNEEFLSSGKIYGNVKFDNSYTDNEIVLSISGIAHNNINETNFVSTKNRWYKTIDLTKYKTLEFYARNGGTGDIMICIDDTIIKRIRYTNVPSTWTKYSVDLSKYEGQHILAIAGGYVDETGSQTSNTQYKNIKLK